MKKKEQKMEDNFKKVIVIITLGILLFISLIFNIYFAFLNNKEVNNKANEKNQPIYNGKYTLENDKYKATLTLEENKNASFEITYKNDEDDYIFYEGKYYIGTIKDENNIEKNVIITYGSDMYNEVFYVIDNNTICEQECKSNNNNKYNKEINDNKKEESKQDDSKEESKQDDSKESNKVKVKSLKEAIQYEINYFDNLSNFSNKSTFQAYQTYVNKLKNADLSNYAESEDKINVYIFAGQSCWHCLDEISWLASNISKYEKYANIYVYEVWNNENNSQLMKDVGTKLNKNVSGVPFTVIGDKYFSGFNEDIGNSIVNLIKDTYNAKDKKDIVNEIIKDYNL